MQLPLTRNVGDWCRFTTHSSSTQITVLPANKAFANEKVAEETCLCVLVADLKQEQQVLSISNLSKAEARARSNTTLALQDSLLNVSSLNPLNEKLLPMLRMLPLIWRVPLAFIKGVPAEQHGVQYHSAGPHICRPAFIELILPHIAQHLRSCKTVHMPIQSRVKTGHSAKQCF